MNTSMKASGRVKPFTAGDIVKQLRTSGSNQVTKGLNKRLIKDSIKAMSPQKAEKVMDEIDRMGSQASTTERAELEALRSLVFAANLLR